MARADLPLQALVHPYADRIVTAETFGDTTDAPLFAEEEAFIANATEGRRLAFVTGRDCARRALAGLGLSPGAIPRNEDGAPEWPAGVVGSITHCAGYRASAVAWTKDVLSIGIDAEPNDELPRGVLGRVSLPPERALLARFAAYEPSVSWGRLLFSAKEALFKLWCSLTGYHLDFRSMIVVFDDSGTFKVLLSHPRSAAASPRIHGHWLARVDIVITVATMVPIW